MPHLIGWVGRFFCWLVVSLPHSWQMALGDLIGLLWFDVLRIRRRLVIDNLLIAFPELAYAQRVRLGRRALCEFGRNIIEYCHMPFLADPRYQSRFVWHGKEHMERALAKGKGAILLTLHLGNGDMAIAALALAGFPIYVVSKLFKTKWLNQLWFGLRERIGVQFIPPRNSSYSVLKALKKNGVVIFVLDQYTGAPIGIRNKFFGHDTGTGIGMAMMAERSQAAVVPGYTIRRGAVWDIYLEEEIPFEKTGDLDQSLAHMTQVYTDRLEQYVRRCPEQWLWLHKRWKKFS